MQKAKQNIANGDNVEYYTQQLDVLQSDYQKIKDIIQENRKLTSEMVEYTGTDDYERMSELLEINQKYRDGVVTA